MGRKLTLQGAKYYGPNANAKTGEPPTLKPGMTVKNLQYLETVPALKSKFPNRFNHKFLEAGQPVTFNGSNMLDSLVHQLKSGDMVNITYKGLEAVPWGKNKGTKAHTYEVELIDSSTKGSGPAEADADSTDEDAENDPF